MGAANIQGRGKEGQEVGGWHLADATDSLFSLYLDFSTCSMPGAPAVVMTTSVPRCRLVSPGDKIALVENPWT